MVFLEIDVNLGFDYGGKSTKCEEDSTNEKKWLEK